MVRDAACAASQPGSQHVDLGELFRRAVAVLGQPADISQASQRPPCADHVEVDAGAVAGDDVAKVLLVPERQGCEVAGLSALRARFHSAEGLHDPDLDRRHDVAVYLQILEDWGYEGIKWQLLDTDRYGTTIRLTHQENPNQLLALAEFLASPNGLRLLPRSAHAISAQAVGGRNLAGFP